MNNEKVFLYGRELTDEEIADFGLEEQAESIPEEPKKSSKFIRGDELIRRRIDEIPSLFGDVIPRSGVVSIVGASDTGKSILQRQLAICVASGKDFLGWENKARYKSAIVVSTEDDDTAISYLLRRHNQSYRFNESEYYNIRFLFDTATVIKDIDEALTEEPADLVVIDSYSDVFNGNDLNQASQVRKSLAEYKSLSLKHDCLFSFLHHTGKRTEQGAPSKNNIAGSQSFEAVMRLVMELRTDFYDEDLRHLCITKGNYLHSSYKKSSFVLKLDDNMVYENTGNRTSFDELKEQMQDSTSKDKKITDPYEIDNEIHLKFLSNAFPFENSEFNKSKLSNKIGQYFGFGDRISEKFIEFYEESQCIENISDNKIAKYIRSINK